MSSLESALVGLDRLAGPAPLLELSLSLCAGGTSTPHTGRALGLMDHRMASENALVSSLDPWLGLGSRAPEPNGQPFLGGSGTDLVHSEIPIDAKEVGLPGANGTSAE